MRQPPAVAEVSSPPASKSVRDDLIAGGRRDEELAGRLVVGMVDHRQPSPRLVGPVFAEERSLAMPVLADPQAGARYAAIRDRERPPFAGLGRRVEGDPQAVVLVLESHRVAPAFTADTTIPLPDLRDARSSANPVSPSSTNRIRSWPRRSISSMSSRRVRRKV